MKLKQLKLKNFRGYNSDTYLEVSDLTALIGKNDVGKSTILEALEIFFEMTEKWNALSEEEKALCEEGLLEL